MGLTGETLRKKRSVKENRVAKNCKKKTFLVNSTKNDPKKVITCSFLKLFSQDFCQNL